ncbi:lectin, mannose-binding 2-like b [Sardina pilchardus]|uniref:lectin, mannose-binding 2-like b n=1 Tax=Sardina pilchardus TaxID=27697 RepID=UPI002E116080
MAASMNKFQLNSFPLPNIVFSMRNVVMKLFLLTFLLFLTNRCQGDDGYESDDFLKREYSLTKPYQGVGSSSSSHWDLMGTAMVTPDHVRLTPDLQSRVGAVWGRLPFFLRDWELHVQFKISGQGKKNLNGDGMALWLTKERMQHGPVFGNMNHFTGLGMFIDTYPNEDKSHERVYPYISVMVGNGTLSYDHDRDGRPTELGGCTALVRNVNHDTIILLRYMRNRLTLMMDIDGKREWRECLDVPGVHMPVGYYFGASSATGDLSDNHDLISMKLYQLTVERSAQEEEEAQQEVLIPSVDHMDLPKVDVEEAEGMGAVSRFFAFLISVLGLCVLVVVGIVLHGRWKDRSRKRFY